MLGQCHRRRNYAPGSTLSQNWFKVQCFLGGCHCKRMDSVDNVYHVLQAHKKGKADQVLRLIIPFNILTPLTRSVCLLIRVPFKLLQPFGRIELIVHIATSLSYQVLIFTWVKWSIGGWSAQHRNNVPRLRGEKDVFSMKILHQVGFETARQARHWPSATL